MYILSKNNSTTYLIIMVVVSFFMLFLASCNNEELIADQITDPITQIPDSTDVGNTPEDEDTGPEVEVILLDDDFFETSENLSVTFSVFANDTNVPSDFIISNNNPLNGSISIDNNNTSNDVKDDTFTYVPSDNFSGTETFQYTLCNPLNPENCGTATVTINVVPEVIIDNDFETNLKAFPSAYGAAANITGGRGGSIYHVTNLNNSGPGSFRDAVSQSNRIIVFDVAGTCRLTSSLTITADNLTIAGQTAPPGGFTLCGYNLKALGANNIIMRYIRQRLDYTNQTWGTTDAADWENCSNIILDHCSFSWGADETLTFRGSSSNITVQRSIIGEGKTGSIFGDSDDASLGKNFSVLNNLYYNVSHRTPNFNMNSRADMINNVVFNWKYRLSRISGAIELNIINNYYATGCLSNSITNIGHMVYGGMASIYTAGNYIDKGVLTNPLVDNWFTVQNWNGGSNPHTVASVSYKSFSAFTQLGEIMPVLSATNAFNDVLTNSGANATLDGSGSIIKIIDNVDTAFLSNVIDGGCESYNSTSSDANFDNTIHWSDFWSKVSSTPIASRIGSYDTDNDGMPDVWERAMFGDLSRDGKGDLDGDGYTDLEEFLNSVDK